MWIVVSPTVPSPADMDIVRMGDVYVITVGKEAAVILRGVARATFHRESFAWEVIHMVVTLHMKWRQMVVAAKQVRLSILGQIPTSLTVLPIGQEASSPGSTAVATILLLISAFQRRMSRTLLVAGLSLISP